MKQKLLPALACCFALCACSIGNKKAVNTKYYSNPIINESAPDPTVIRASNGFFYLYGTEDTRNTPIYKSKDLTNWEFAGTAFTDTTRPQWSDFKGGHLWAPEIRFFDNKYVLYYSYAIWGNIRETGIGVATADSPEGPFIDHGRILNFYTTGVQNCIDQFFYEENGKRYLFWGSFHGIYAVELTPDGLSMKLGSDGNPKLTKIAGNAFEGVNIYKRKNYYYLLASVGTCCEGAKSTYQTVVGRSKSLFGPYVDKKGVKMLDNGYEVILKGDEHWAGTGHNSTLIKDDSNNEWIVYHGYKKDQANKGRVVLMDPVHWTKDGWPYIEGGIPSNTTKAPIVK